MSVLPANPTDSVAAFQLFLDEDPPTDYGEPQISRKKISTKPDDDLFSVEYKNVPSIALIHTWFSVLQLHTGVVVVVLAGILIFFILTFAGVYYVISPRCGLHLQEDETPVAASVLFSVLVHFRSAMNPPTEIHGPTFLWDGCPAGGVALFCQLFVGNILMSVIISSLMLSFQSSGRRNQGRFTAVTVSKDAVVVVEENDASSSSSSTPTFCLQFKIVDTNSVNGNSKLADCVASVWVFDPMSVPAALRVIERKVALVQVALPTVLSVQIPFEYIFEKGKKLNHPIMRFAGLCEVCGKGLRSFRQYALHLECSSDPLHDAEYEKLMAENNFLFSQLLCPEQVLYNLRERGCQFLLIVEARDPTTGNRVLTKKIYHPASSISTKNFPKDLSLSRKGAANIYYDNYM